MDTQKITTTIPALAVARLFNNMTRRFAYPFIPAIGRELDVATSSVQSVIATNAGVGIISPIFGPLSEHYGRKNVMLLALALMGVGAVPGIFAPVYGIFYFTMVVFGLSKIIFDPAMQAYIGDLVPYQYRGRAIGTTELAWAGSLIVAAPITGLLIQEFGLSAVFGMLLFASIAAFLLIWYFVPKDIPDKTTEVPNFFTSLRVVWQSPVAMATLGFILFFVTANELISISYAKWMEDAFEMKITALGTAAIVIALAEVTGEFLVIGIVDKFGKKRLAMVGVLGASVAYIGLTQLGSLTAGLIGLFVTYLFVETAIVASIPLFTEILPSARSVMMSVTMAGHAISRFTGAMLGGQIYNRGEFALIGIVAAVLCAVSLLILWTFVHENHASKITGVTRPAESS